jgi:gamma-glutamyl-gamma-aminobutyrate hydrolase PuuD
MRASTDMKRVLIPYRHEKKVRPYEAAIRAGGMEPVAASVAERQSLGDFDGMLLMGGTDVGPQLYGEQPAPETELPDNERDDVELNLIHEAIERDIAVLGICRGLQMLNVYHGGTLIQHVADSSRHDPDTGDRSISVHPVRFEPGSKLAKIAGAQTWVVNSSHHQAAGRIGSRLIVTARDANDETVEGIERGDRRFVVAVQWHPEDQINSRPEQLRLFQAFADALG